MAVKEALKIGLIKKKCKLDAPCVCAVPPYVTKISKKSEKSDESSSSDDDEDIQFEYELKRQLISSSLKNFTAKFQSETVPETSSYVELRDENRKPVFKKSSICWLFGKTHSKCSSDRRYRVI